MLDRRALLEMDGWKAAACWTANALMIAAVLYDLMIVVI